MLFVNEGKHIKFPLCNMLSSQVEFGTEFSEFVSARWDVFISTLYAHV